MSRAAAAPGTPGTGADRSSPEAEIRSRVARLEQGFGDPGDPDNPLGFRAVLAAEKDRRLLPAAEQLLAEQGFGSELVPARYGGRLERADVLARIVRPVFRRDMGLGIGYGITSLFAASPVWAAGSEQQRASLARVLCGGGRAAIVHHSMAHGNALLRGELSAMQNSRGFRLSGRKDVVINAARADALVVYARTDPAPGSRSHSVLLLDPGELPADRLRDLPRQATTGLRGCSFSGLEFDDCQVPADALVGESGTGVRLALRTFQLHRPLSAVAVIAAVDTVLRSAVRAAHQGGPGTILRKRHRPLLAGVFADLLACDSLATTVLRALHLQPRSAHLAAANVKYLVPDLLREDLEELATVLGAGDHGRDGDQRMLSKLMRDLPTAGLGHAGTAACQSVVIPQLPSLARTSWLRSASPPAALFGPEEPLSALDISTLAVVGGDDFLAASLVATAQRLPHGTAAGAYGGVLRSLVDGLLAELRDLRDRCAAIEPGDLAALSSPATFALADRHALVSCAGAALGVWDRHRDSGSFLGDPSWLVLALHRLGRRLCLPALPELPEHCVERVLAEVLGRFHQARAYDLYDTPLAWDGAR